MNDVRPAAPRPVTIGLAPSFGFGDRIGLATPGHVAAMQSAGGGYPTDLSPAVDPRDDPHGTIAAAGHAGCAVQFAALRLEGADRGATPITSRPRDDVDSRSTAGFSFFTIDPSAHVDAHADDYDEATLRAKYAQITRPRHVGRSVSRPTDRSVRPAH